MESQPRTSGGAEGRSSDDIVYELADTVINSIITFISLEDANIFMFKVNFFYTTQSCCYKLLLSDCLFFILQVFRENLTQYI